MPRKKKAEQPATIRGYKTLKKSGEMFSPPTLTNGEIAYRRMGGPEPANIILALVDDWLHKVTAGHKGKLTLDTSILLPRAGSADKDRIFVSVKEETQIGHGEI